MFWNILIINSVSVTYRFFLCIKVRAYAGGRAPKANADWQFAAPCYFFTIKWISIARAGYFLHRPKSSRVVPLTHREQMSQVPEKHLARKRAYPLLISGRRRAPTPSYWSGQGNFDAMSQGTNFRVVFVSRLCVE